jgi:cytochrome c oxidase cbb3-type subunit 3
VKDIFKSIKYGWQDKGMKSWKDDFSPKEIQELTSFVRSLKGTKPATAKDAQGALYVEATTTGPVAVADSTTTDTTKAK